jgi:hypothetical protein
MATHTHRTPERKRLQLNKKISEILRTVPYEKGFHFYTDLGYFTGKTATNLDAFEKVLQVVTAASVNFHFQRGDFQKWIEETLGDKELAKRIDLIKLPYSAEELRKEMLAIVRTRITQLKRELPPLETCSLVD